MSSDHVIDVEQIEAPDTLVAGPEKKSLLHLART
jgi:hypothetical protein